MQYAGSTDIAASISSVTTSIEPGAVAPNQLQYKNTFLHISAPTVSTDGLRRIVTCPTSMGGGSPSPKIPFEKHFITVAPLLRKKKSGNHLAIMEGSERAQAQSSQIHLYAAPQRRSKGDFTTDRCQNNINSDIRWADLVSEAGFSWNDDGSWAPSWHAPSYTDPKQKQKTRWAESEKAKTGSSAQWSYISRDHSAQGNYGHEYSHPHKERAKYGKGGQYGNRDDMRTTDNRHGMRYGDNQYGMRYGDNQYGGNRYEDKRYGGNQYEGKDKRYNSGPYEKNTWSDGWSQTAPQSSWKSSKGTATKGQNKRSKFGPTAVYIDLSGLQRIY